MHSMPTDMEIEMQATQYERAVSPPEPWITIDENEIQRVLEERASDEASTNSEGFADWLAEHYDVAEFAPLVATVYAHAVLEANAIAERIVNDWKQYRCAMADETEREEIVAELLEDFCA